MADKRKWSEAGTAQDAEITAALRATTSETSIMEVLHSKPRSWVIGFVLRAAAEHRLSPRDMDVFRQRLYEMFND